MTRYDRRLERIASRAEATRELVQLTGELERSRDADWYRWAAAYGAQEHLHGSRRLDGSPAACPVTGCELGVGVAV